MEPSLFGKSSSHGKDTDASRDFGCDPWSIDQPHPPYLARALASAWGAIYEGVTFCTMSQFLTLGNQWQDLEILIFCYKRIWWKIRSHTRTSSGQVSSWSICPFKRYRRNTGFHEPETDSRHLISVSAPWGPVFQRYPLNGPIEQNETWTQGFQHVV